MPRPATASVVSHPPPPVRTAAHTHTYLYFLYEGVCLSFFFGETAVRGCTYIHTVIIYKNIWRYMATQVGKVVEEKVAELLPEEEEKEELDELRMSSLTLDRVAAAKKYIEDHYKSHMKLIQQRKERSFFGITKIYL